MDPRDPTTLEVLRNPEKHEGIRTEMRGTLVNKSLEDGSVLLTVEKYDRYFDIYYEMVEDDEFDDFERGDLVRVVGISKLDSQGYVEAEIFYHRTMARDRALSLLSILGFVIVIVVIIIDRDVLKEMIFDA